MKHKYLPDHMVKDIKSSIYYRIGYLLVKARVLEILGHESKAMFTLQAQKNNPNLIIVLLCDSDVFLFKVRTAPNTLPDLSKSDFGHFHPKSVLDLSSRNVTSQSCRSSCYRLGWRGAGLADLLKPVPWYPEVLGEICSFEAICMKWSHDLWLRFHILTHLRTEVTATALQKGVIQI